jgi:hypothetical protein
MESLPSPEFKPQYHQEEEEGEGKEKKWKG